MLSITSFPTWKALVNTSSGIEGLEAKRVVGTTADPGKWLLKAVKRRAFLSPTFSWKWTRPLGTTNICPTVNTLEWNTLLVVTNPTSSFPSMTTPVSVARGCEWGGFSPPGAKSTRFMEIPRELRPGKARTFAAVTDQPNMFVVFPSSLNPSKKKSSEVTFASGLQGKPFTDRGAFKSATQKSCSGSGSAEFICKGRSNNPIRVQSKWNGGIEIMAVAKTVGRVEIGKWVSGYSNNQRSLVFTCCSFISFRTPLTILAPNMCKLMMTKKNRCSWLTCGTSWRDGERNGIEWKGWSWDIFKETWNGQWQWNNI